MQFDVTESASNASAAAAAPATVVIQAREAEMHTAQARSDRRDSTSAFLIDPAPRTRNTDFAATVASADSLRAPSVEAFVGASAPSSCVATIHSAHDLDCMRQRDKVDARMAHVQYLLDRTREMERMLQECTIRASRCAEFYKQIDRQLGKARESRRIGSGRSAPSQGNQQSFGYTSNALRASIAQRCTSSSLSPANVFLTNRTLASALLACVCCEAQRRESHC